MAYNPNEPRDSQGRWSLGWRTAGGVALGAVGLGLILAHPTARKEILHFLGQWHTKVPITGGTSHGPNPTFELFRRASLLSELTPKELSALKAYTSDGFDNLNYFLRGQVTRASPNSFKNSIDLLDGALKKASLSEATTVYRGMDQTVYDRMMKHLKVGDTFVDHAYGSTTLDPRVAINSIAGGPIFKVTVPRGYSALPLGEKATSHIGEVEVLLKRGSQFRVASLGGRGNPVHLEVI